MKRHLSSLLTIFAATFALLSAPVAVRADPLQLSILAPATDADPNPTNEWADLGADPTQWLSNTLSFTATIYNGSSDTLYMNLDSPGVDSPLTLDDSPFITNFFEIDSEQTVSGVIFNITVDPSTPAGSYNWNFSILGGTVPFDDPSYEPWMDNTLATDIGGVNLESTNSGSGAGVVPEPCSLVLLASGLAGLTGAVRKRVARQA